MLLHRVKQEKTWRCFCLSVAAHLRECQEIRMSLVTHSPTAIKCIIFGSLKTETNPRPAGVAMLGYWDACNIICNSIYRVFKLN